MQDVGEFPFNDVDAVAERAKELRSEPGKELGIVEYPIRSWECPHQSIADRILEYLDEFDNPPRGILALTAEQRELAAVRAGLLWMSVDSAMKPLPIHVHENDDEAIIILLGQSENPIG